MPASDALFTSTAALLLIAVAWHVPRLAGTMSPGGFAYCASGALLPLLDPLRFSFTSEDQIAFLTQDPLFAGPLPGLAAVGLAAGAAALLGASGRRCAQWASWTVVGLALAVGLAGLTPRGAPWLAPFSPRRYALPLLPEGHLWLLAAAAIALGSLEGWPASGRPPRTRLRQSIVWGLSAWVVLLAVPGAIACAGLLGSSGDGARAEEHRGVEPDPLWPGRWLEIAVAGDDYLAYARGLGGASDGPDRVPRWNDQLALLRLLEDPAVRRMYFEVFRHPVALTEAAGSKIRLTVRELADARIDAPGPTLRIETDNQGRQRWYRVERLD